jgi:hypothetical protein
MVGGVERLLLSVGTEGRLDRWQSASPKHKCTGDLRSTVRLSALCAGTMYALGDSQRGIMTVSPPTPVLSAHICLTTFRDMQVDFTRTYQSVYPSTYGESHLRFQSPKNSAFDLAFGRQVSLTVAMPCQLC